MGMSSSHDSKNIKEMLQSIFPGCEFVEMGDDLEGMSRNGMPLSIFDLLRTNRRV
jgi:hypothetical protein